MVFLKFRLVGHIFFKVISLQICLVAPQNQMSEITNKQKKKDSKVILSQNQIFF